MQNNSQLSTHNSQLTTVLVTGCAGFIGSNFVPYFLEKYPDVRLINLDLLTYAGNLDNLSDVDEILQNSKFKIQNSKSKIQSPKFKIQNSKSKIQNGRYINAFISFLTG